MTAAAPRPRIVDVAFWSWITGAVLLMLGGLLSAMTSFGTIRDAAASSVSDDEVRAFLTFHRGVGVLCILLGIGIGYLAGRTRHGDKRFRRATVTLSLVGAALLVACAWFVGLPLPALLATLALLVAAALATRPSAAAWFDASDQREGAGG